MKLKIFIICFNLFFAVLFLCCGGLLFMKEKPFNRIYEDQPAKIASAYLRANSVEQIERLLTEETQLKDLCETLYKGITAFSLIACSAFLFNVGVGVYLYTRKNKPPGA